MIPVIPKQATDSLINYLTNSCVGLLIYMPELGLTDSTTPEELNLRKSLTMIEAANHEVGGLSLNGYQRSSPLIEIDSGDDHQTINYSVSFTASGGQIGPFSHLVISRGTTFEINPATGNGRGNSDGQAILVVPTGIETLEEGHEYESSIPLNISNYL